MHLEHNPMRVATAAGNATPPSAASQLPPQPQPGSIAEHRRLAGSHSPYILYCFTAAVLGFAGFWLTLVASYAEVCAVVEDPSATYSSRGTLTHWPSTISELNSDWKSARGRLFFGFMLATSALLFASRMPYELDTLPLEELAFKETGATPDARSEPQHVCCLADCGTRCDWTCAQACGNGRVYAQHVGGRLADPRLGQFRTVEEEPLCCAGTACASIERNLVFLRSMLAPLGVLFVALCPTLNFWSEHLPGGDVVRKVHLAAAAALFAGGTITETTRIYFLWCESRAAGIRNGHPDVHSSSCWIFIQGTDQEPHGIGPVRPWLCFCLVVGLIAAGTSLHESGSMERGAFSLRVERGDVLLSPVKTAYCPQPDFAYLEVETLDECNRATDRLREGWIRDDHIPGCNGKPVLENQDGCDACPGLAFVSSMRLCSGCSFDGNTRITPDNVGRLTPKARLCPGVFPSRTDGQTEWVRSELMRPFKRRKPNATDDSDGFSDEGQGFVSAPASSGCLVHRKSVEVLVGPGEIRDEKLKPPGGVVPDTQCNLLNFDERQRRCLPHKMDQSMDFLARCTKQRIENPLYSHGLPLGCDLDRGICRSGGFPGAAKCCSGGQTGNESVQEACCAEACPRGPFPWVKTASNSASDNCGLADAVIKGIFEMPEYSCRAAVITPGYLAVCVCDPENSEQNDCTWPTSVNAKLRLRLFVQESLLAILLLMNYMEIVVEHMLGKQNTMRLPGQAVVREACCRAWTLRLLQAAVPFSIMVIALAITAFNNDHGVHSGVLDVADDIAFAWGGFMIYETQLKVYWLSAFVVLCMLGRAMWPARPVLLVVYVTAVCSTLAGGFYHQYSGSEASAAWFADGVALLLAWVTLVAARRKAIGQLKLCCASTVGCVILGWMAIHFLEDNCGDSVLGAVSSKLAYFFFWLLVLVLLHSCCRLPCCEKAGNERRALGMDVPLMPMGPI